MRFTLLMVVCVSCAGPSAHERPWDDSAQRPASAPTARAPVATTLAGADPLLAKDCELPTAPFVPCPDLAPDEPPPTHHHEAPPPAPPAPVVPARTAPSAPAAVRPAKVKDPICGMMIDPTKAAGGSVSRHGVTTHFCSATCKRTFLARVADGGFP
jgi:YHS domain-containing protein